MGKHIRHIRKQSSGAAALYAAGLLGVSLLCLPLASAAGRFGLDGQDGIVEIAAAGVGMQDVTPMATPMALRDVRVSGLPQLHDDAATVAEKNKSVPFFHITLEDPWIVPRSSEWPYQKGRFATDLARRACAELLQGYKFESLGWKSPVCKLVEITTLPKHGTLVNEGNGGYGFKPARGYLGTDSLQYLVEGQDGRRILITLPIRVRTLADALSFNDATTIQVDGNLAAWEWQAQLSAVLEFGVRGQVWGPGSGLTFDIHSTIP